MNRFVTLFVSLVVFVIGGGCAIADSADPAPTETAVLPPTATPSPTATRTPAGEPLAGQTIVARTPTPTAAPPTTTITLTPSTIPTSDLVTGWLTYENDFFAYRFSYPPGATIRTRGVAGFPTEELPAGMTGAEYLRQLEENYPDDICVTVQYRLCFVIFRPPDEAGGIYTGPCGVTGVGAYDIFSISETVTIDDYPYTARGWLLRERDETAAWVSQFYFVTLGDGTAIHFGSMSGTEEQYLEIKETLPQIAASFRSQATSLPVLTPTPTPIPGLVAGAAGISVGDWSADGRFLTYWTHTAGDLQVGPQFPPGDFHIYDALRQQSCPLSGYRSGSTSWKRRHLWLGDGRIVVFGDEDALSLSPCGDDAEVLTAHFPEPVTRVVAHSPDRAHFLLASDNHYWLYRPEGHEVRPVTGLAEGFENGASFSPSGRFVALSGDGGNSFLLDVETAEASQVAAWQGPQGLGGLGPPDWLDNTRFIIRGSRDQGPLLVGVDGTVQNAAGAFFGLPADPGPVALASRSPQTGHFVLLLQDTNFDGQQPPLRLYYSTNAFVQSLPIAPPLDRVDPSFSPGGRWLVLYDYGRDEAGSYNELWVRHLGSVAELSRLYESGETIYYRFAPNDERVALKVGNYIRIEAAPPAETVLSQGYSPYDVFPYAWSPGSRYLAVLGYTEDHQRQALFVLETE